MSRTYKKAYTKSKAVDATCRGGGSCPACKNNRIHKFEKQQLASDKFEAEHDELDEDEDDTGITFVTENYMTFVELMSSFFNIPQDIIKLKQIKTINEICIYVNGIWISYMDDFFIQNMSRFEGAVKKAIA